MTLQASLPYYPGCTKGRVSVITFPIGQSMCSAQVNHISCYLNIIPRRLTWFNVHRLLRPFLNSMDSAEFEMTNLGLSSKPHSSCQDERCWRVRWSQHGAPLLLCSGSDLWMRSAQSHPKSGRVLPTAFEIPVSRLLCQLLFLYILNKPSPQNTRAKNWQNCWREAMLKAKKKKNNKKNVI